MLGLDMAGTLRLSLDLTTADPAVGSSQQSALVRDPVASSHDYVDATPRNVATAGALGATFVQLETPVAQVERFVADVPAGADLVARFGGAPAVVVGSVTSPTIAGGETIQLAIDAGSPVTTTLQAGDTSIALVAKRINYAHGAQVASVDPTTGGLRLTGVLTGGADARARGFGYGLVQVIDGTGLSALGLSAGSTYGTGDDQRVGAGLFAKSFPAAALPRRIELSGTASGAKFWVAGKAA